MGRLVETVVAGDGAAKNVKHQTGAGNVKKSKKSNKNSKPTTGKRQRQQTIAAAKSRAKNERVYTIDSQYLPLSGDPPEQEPAASWLSNLPLGSRSCTRGAAKLVEDGVAFADAYVPHVAKPHEVRGMWYRVSILHIDQVSGDVLIQRADNPGAKFEPDYPQHLSLTVTLNLVRLTDARPPLRIVVVGQPTTTVVSAATAAAAKSVVEEDDDNATANNSNSS